MVAALILGAVPLVKVTEPAGVYPDLEREVITGILVPLETFLVPLVAASYASKLPEPPAILVTKVVVPPRVGAEPEIL
jgi:hypothetical protein